jgi:hypothetical protein
VIGTVALLAAPTINGPPPSGYFGSPVVAVVLVDIRRFPGSRKHPHFHRDNLASGLQKAGVEYHWLEDLGGRRHKQRDESPNLGLENEGFRNYADYMLTDEFRKGVEQLLESPDRNGQRSCALRACSGSATGGWSVTSWWRTE